MCHLVWVSKRAINEHWNVGVEFGWRKLFTDYVDDVSSTYVSKEILIAENGLLSWELSNRYDEVNDGVEWLKDDTYLRGDPADKDWYFFCGFIASYNLDPIIGAMTGFHYFDQTKNRKFRGLRDSRKGWVARAHPVKVFSLVTTFGVIHRIDE